MVYYCFTNVITYCTSICKATGFVMVVWNCRGKHPKSDGWLWLSSLKLRFLGMRYFQTNPTEGEMNSEHIPHRLVLPKVSQIYVEKKLQTNFILPQISLFPLGSTTPVVAFPLHFIGPARICEDMPMIQALNCIFESVYPQKMINAFKYIYIYIQIVFSLLRSSVWHTSFDGDERSAWTATVIWRKLDGEIANNAEIPLPFPLGPHPWLVAC